MTNAVMINTVMTNAVIPAQAGIRSRLLKVAGSPLLRDDMNGGSL